MLAADNWCIKVEDRIYGPYSSAQLRKYAHEGRFGPASLVAPAASREFKAARDEPAFSAFFGAAPAMRAPQPAFGRANVATAADHSNDATAGKRPRSSGARRHSAEAEVANFVIIFDSESAAANRIAPTLANLGPSFRLAPNVWTVRCAVTAIGLRNLLAPMLSPSDPVFVIDADNGRACWQNYAPEAHAKISAAFMAQAIHRAAS